MIDADLERYANHHGYPEELPSFRSTARSALSEIIALRSRIKSKDAEIERLTKALERIALLDEADGYTLKEADAFRAVAIACETLGKHPSQIATRNYEQEVSKE